MNVLMSPDRIPARIKQVLDDYGRHGLQPGSCIRALLEGNVFTAIARADDDVCASLVAIVVYISNQLPASSYGSPEIVSRWLTERAKERSHG